MATAQKRRTSVKKMTEKLSLGTVKNLLRCSISNVCWIRGLFHHENFQDKTVKDKIIVCSKPDAKTYVTFC